MNLITITAPTIEPITVDDAQAFCRVATSEDENGLFISLIKAARIGAETFLRAAIMQQTLELRLQSFPADGQIVLPMPPVKFEAFPTALTNISVKYLDGAKVEQTFSAANYYLEGQTLHLESAAAWPDIYTHAAAVRVRYVTGHADRANVPENIKQAIRVMVSTMYEHRESMIVGTIGSKLPIASEHLLWGDRVLSL